MCRVAVRNTTRARPSEAVPNAEDALLYEQLQGMADVKHDIDFDELFDADEVDIDADLQFLEMFNGQPVEMVPKVEAVLGQPVEATPYQQVATSVAAIPVMQQQPQQHQQQQQQQPQQPIAMHIATGMMQGSTSAFAPTAAALHHQYTQAILQQHMLAQLQTGTSGGAMSVNKRGKTAAEIAEQQERIKRRRRESAQRSRQRKSAYMKTLECENHALKVENDRLRRELSRLGRPLPPMFNSVTTSGSSAENKIDDVSDPYTGASSDGGLCPVDVSGLGSGAAQELMGMAL